LPAGDVLPSPGSASGKIPLIFALAESVFMAGSTVTPPAPATSLFFRPGRDNSKLARHIVPGNRPKMEFVLKGRRKICRRIPASLQDAKSSAINPATSCLANFPRRSATSNTAIAKAFSKQQLHNFWLCRKCFHGGGGFNSARPGGKPVFCQRRRLKTAGGFTSTSPVSL
jgi:hypothetical protein